jgi:putative ABC transport system ATP-binding protein
MTDRGTAPPGVEPSPAVELTGVTMTYREAGAVTTVLQDAGFSVPQGRSASLVGVSGSGKSTLLSLVAGLLRPDGGRIVVDGQDLADLDQAGLSRLRAGRVGVVQQTGNLVPFLTAAENVELACRLGGGDRRAALDLLGELGLAGRAGHLPRRLSGGEAQRAAVAVALANDPAVLLADEATGELDGGTADQVMELILRLCADRGMTVLFATHNREHAARADLLLHVAKGEVRPA